MSEVDARLPPTEAPGEVVWPGWLAGVLGLTSCPAEEDGLMVQGLPMVMRGGILRSSSIVSEAQQQTEDAFGFKWNQRHTFERKEVLAETRAWLVERYGNVAEEGWLKEYGDSPLLLDAGCGAGLSALELFGPVLQEVRYLGVDLSAAIDVAAMRFAERGLAAGFLQADFTQLPLTRCSVDVIFSEGALHHTDSTRNAFIALAQLLKPRGRFMVYVYLKKGPIREFTDDYVRSRLQGMGPEEAWGALMSLTKLGKQIGELGIDFDIPEPIEILQIPAGPISLQRFLYWHVFKAFYRPGMTLEEMNHINFDWYAPRNAHRHTVEEVRSWCAEAGLIIERERIEDSGITAIARKRDG